MFGVPWGNRTNATSVARDANPADGSLTWNSRISMVTSG